MKNKTAFTLLEVMMVIVLIAIVLGMTTSFTNRSIILSSFNNTIYEIKQNMLNMVSYNRFNYGNSSAYVIYTSSGFTAFDGISTITNEFDANVSLTSITFTNNQLAFDTFTGNPIETGSLKLVDSLGNSATIAIDENGIISVTY